MRNIILMWITVISSYTSGQVSIGKTNVTNSSVSLEFGTGEKGLVLPWVNTVATMPSVVNGTMAYDLSDHRVKVKYASGWNDLSRETTGTTIDPVTGIDGVLIQNSANENISAKVSIGTLSSIPGILVLEDTDRAMILPKVANPHLTIINPAPGMMVYDTVSKLLAVYNGTVWSFWKP
ncbi:hypothetical protein [Chryseobacterium sp.]|uniref:hypothetical protein n=1 Tax=Chryseobacterium sp. TaxID=1871047 RepID=UPI002FC5D7EA